MKTQRIGTVWLAALTFVAVLAACGVAHAQDGGVATSDGATHVTTGRRDNDGASLGDPLHVRFDTDDLRALTARAQVENRPVALFLDNVLVRGVYGAKGDTPGTVRHFLLARTGENRDAWARLLGGRALKPREVVVAVGFEDRSVVVAVGSVSLRPMRSPYGWLLLGVVVIVAALVVYALRSGSLLRDGEPPSDGGRRAFSLARVQAMVWTVLVAVAYFAIWAVTGAADALTGSVVQLLGISAGTLVGAALVDSNKRALSPAAVVALVEQRNALQSPPTPTPGETAATAAARADELARVERQLRVAPRAYVPASEGFWKDMLSDAAGPALHRLQAVLWTVALMIIFIVEVAERLAMPDFDNTLIALMGVSAATYVGLKVPERTA